MSIIGTLIIGFLAGLVAKLLMPGRDPKGFIVTIVLGVVGAFLATWLGQQLGWYNEGEPQASSAPSSAPSSYWPSTG